ncbi:transcription elongation factor GreA [Wolbachia endosymbiont of Howardula sp.]|uniref:transcription elongation factor GreA n=1 Tax=Wolbachia endosymbiont of Howardula sp. TaxID=2916816 RepID=UPI00217ECC8F|nr:transcription elongation factor GreA [Wolbachia endosymbiont of Howardula sp.]UWI83427.1 transcription elongation factor GreA [Wolbachia endosymbiont of Howardula sp.]
MHFSIIHRFPITQEGLQNMYNELAKIKEEKPHIIQSISDSRDQGDLSENAEYHAAREKLGFIEGRIIELEHKIAHAEVIEINNLSGDIIMFGATVTLRILNDDTKIIEYIYKIVGEYEVDIANNLISIHSPIGSALIGKRVGDDVEVTVPSGEKLYKVIKVEFK